MEQKKTNKEFPKFLLMLIIMLIFGIFIGTGVLLRLYFNYTWLVVVLGSIFGPLFFVAGICAVMVIIFSIWEAKIAKWMKVIGICCFLIVCFLLTVAIAKIVGWPIWWSAMVGLFFSGVLFLLVEAMEEESRRVYQSDDLWDGF